MADHPAEHGSNLSPNNLEASDDWLRTLDEIEGTDLPLVGGKAYRLAMLKQNGLNVLPGLVLTTHFFETQLKQTHLNPLWAGSPDVAVTAEALSWLADALKTTPLVKPLAAALSTSLTELFGPDAGSFAVRSSIIDEDQRDHTFAGIHLTELGVPRSAIAIAISRCWASALSESAIKYRQVHGMSIQAIQIAVLIQPMLSPDCSGVGFTVNPLSGARTEMVIEATPGLGSALVSGEVQPHFFRLATQPGDYPLLEERTGARPVSLPAAERTELARQLHQIEALMGEPQDVEWARQAGRFFILQTRPAAIPTQLPPAADNVWGRGNYADYLPEIPSPYFSSMLVKAQPQVMQTFVEFGVDTSPFGSFERIIYGRPYLNLSLLRRLAAQMGLNPDRMLSAMGLAPTTTAGLGIDWPTAWRARGIYRRLFQQIRPIEQRYRQTEAQIEEIISGLKHVSPDDSLEVRLHHLRQHVSLYAAISQLNLTLKIGHAFVVGLIGALTGLSPRQIIAENNALVPDPFRQVLAQLGRLARQDDVLKNYLLNFSGEGEPPPLPAEFEQQLEQVLSDFGERAIRDGDPAQPRFHQEKHLLFSAIQPYVPPPDSQNAGNISHPSPPAWNSWLLKPLRATLKSLLATQHKLDGLRAEATGACRRWALRFGRYWCAEGWLVHPHDVFWLTLDEIERVFVGGAPVAVTLKSTVQARKDTHQLYAGTSLPLVVQNSALTTFPLGERGSIVSSPDVVLGLPVSPGQVRGTVVVVTQPDRVPPLVQDTILVLPSTGPNWLPLLHRAVGLVVETGGLLSHGSVIAREYGLPAVANIPDATRRFQTGDKILVDGSTGVIQPLESASTTGK